MSRETFINNSKTILNTDFYLYLLQKEIDAKKYKEVIDKAIKELENGHANWIILDILKEVE